MEERQTNKNKPVETMEFYRIGILKQFKNVVTFKKYPGRWLLECCCYYAQEEEPMAWAWSGQCLDFEFRMTQRHGP